MVARTPDSAPQHRGWLGCAVAALRARLPPRSGRTCDARARHGTQPEDSDTCGRRLSDAWTALPAPLALFALPASHKLSALPAAPALQASRALSALPLPLPAVPALNALRMPELGAVERRLWGVTLMGPAAQIPGFTG
jgi:hypothetical protein